MGLMTVIITLLTVRNTLHQPYAMASTLHMRTAIMPGYWKPWRSFSFLLSIIWTHQHGTTRRIALFERPVSANLSQTDQNKYIVLCLQTDLILQLSVWGLLTVFESCLETEFRTTLKSGKKYTH